MKMMNAKNITTINKMHNVKAGPIYDTEHAIAVHITLEAGERLKPHLTPVDVFFYVLEGTPTIEVGEERETVGADHLVESPAKIKHCIYNDTEQVARILVVKTPKPTTQTRLL